MKTSANVGIVNVIVDRPENVLSKDPVQVTPGFLLVTGESSSSSVRVSSPTHVYTTDQMIPMQTEIISMTLHDNTTCTIYGAKGSVVTLVSYDALRNATVLSVYLADHNGIASTNQAPVDVILHNATITNVPDVDVSIPILGIYHFKMATPHLAEAIDMASNKMESVSAILGSVEDQLMRFVLDGICNMNWKAMITDVTRARIDMYQRDVINFIAEAVTRIGVRSTINPIQLLHSMREEIFSVRRATVKYRQIATAFAEQGREEKIEAARRLANEYPELITTTELLSDRLWNYTSTAPLIGCTEQAISDLSEVKSEDTGRVLVAGPPLQMDNPTIIRVIASVVAEHGGNIDQVKNLLLINTEHEHGRVVLKELVRLTKTETFLGEHSEPQCITKNDLPASCQSEKGVKEFFFLDITHIVEGVAKLLTKVVCDTLPQLTRTFAQVAMGKSTRRRDIDAALVDYVMDASVSIEEWRKYATQGHPSRILAESLETFCKDNEVNLSMPKPPPLQRSQAVKSPSWGDIESDDDEGEEDAQMPELSTTPSAQNIQTLGMPRQYLGSGSVRKIVDREDQQLNATNPAFNRLMNAQAAEEKDAGEVQASLQAPVTPDDNKRGTTDVKTPLTFSAGDKKKANAVKKSALSELYETEGFEFAKNGDIEINKSLIVKIPDGDAKGTRVMILFKYDGKSNKLTMDATKTITGKTPQLNDSEGYTADRSVPHLFNSDCVTMTKMTVDLLTYEYATSIANKFLTVIATNTRHADERDHVSWGKKWVEMILSNVKIV